MVATRLYFIRIALPIVAFLYGGVVDANASAISATADPFPANTELTTGTQVWQSADFQILDGVDGNLSVQSDVFSAGNETLVLNTVFTGQLVDLNTSTTTAFVLPGTIDVTIAGRTAAGSTGSWAATIQSLAVGGIVNSSFTIVTNVVSPVSVSSVSAGTVQIAATGGGTYNIDDSFTLYPQISSNGGPPEAFAPVLLTNADVPEPTTWALLALPFAGLFWLRRRGRA